jgi:hypothetical protein
MSNWTSHDGKWFPSKEKVALTNITSKVKEINGQKVQPGDPFIYEGPDRAAMFELFKDKVENLGMDFRNDTELINRVRQLGYKSVDAYAKEMGYDKVESEKRFLDKASVITKHELPTRVKEVSVMGGGSDSTGSGADVIGGFGDERIRPASELD